MAEILSATEVADLMTQAEVSMDGDPLLTLAASHEHLRAERDAALAAVQDVMARMHLSADPWVWEFADELATVLGLSATPDA